MGVEGNEQADAAAKAAAEGEGERAEPAYLREASISHLTRETTEARSEATIEWISNHVGRRRRYRPPKGGRLRKALARTRKELEGRFYQLLSGHAAVADRLVRVGQAPSDLSGGVEVARSRHVSITLPSAGSGNRRLGDCGKEWRWIVGGEERGPHQSAAISGMSEQCRQSWSSWKTPRLGK